jgi:hypothetical protein
MVDGLGASNFWLNPIGRGFTWHAKFLALCRSIKNYMGSTAVLKIKYMDEKKKSNFFYARAACD